MAINRIEQTYRKLTAAGRNILKLFSGNPNEQGIVFPPQLLKNVYQGYFEAQGYSPHPKGLPAARQAISKFYQRAEASVDAESIILTSGTSESFFYLFSLLAQPGDNILIPNPSYPLFDQIAKLVRIELRPYRLLESKRWEIDVENLWQKTDAKTRAIVLISPHNPTGAVASIDSIKQIAHWANQKEIPLICDEVFSEFYFGDARFPRPMTVAPPKLCFTLNGISKMFALPALKLGWIAVTGETSLMETAVDRLETTADTFLSVQIPIQQALPLLFQERRFVEEYKAEVVRRKRFALDLLGGIPDLRIIPPQGGFYLMAEVTKQLPCSEEEFVIRLMEQESVFVHPGYFYDYEKGIHLVISFLTESERLRTGLQAVSRFLKG